MAYDLFSEAGESLSNWIEYIVPVVLMINVIAVTYIIIKAIMRRLQKRRASVVKPEDRIHKQIEQLALYEDQLEALLKTAKRSINEANEQVLIVDEEAYKWYRQIRLKLVKHMSDEQYEYFYKSGEQACCVVDTEDQEIPVAHVELLITVIRRSLNSLTEKSVAVRVVPWAASKSPDKQYSDLWTKGAVDLSKAEVRGKVEIVNKGKVMFRAEELNGLVEETSKGLERLENIKVEVERDEYGIKVALRKILTVGMGTLEKIIEELLPPTRIPSMTKAGRFMRVLTPWRTKRPMPARFYESVTQPRREGDPTYPAVIADEKELFYRGEIDGEKVDLLEQKYPYALRHFLILIGGFENVIDQILRPQDIMQAIRWVAPKQHRPLQNHIQQLSRRGIYP